MKNKRILGSYTSDKEGPLLFITAAVHGNEPSGVMALKAVFSELNKTQPQIKGTFLGLIANEEAFKESKRYLDEDLNRTWTNENLENPDDNSNEQQEMLEIIDIIDDYRKKDFTEIYFIDCHTTSSASLPYISVQDIGKNDTWAQQFPIHIIRGFSDIVSGTIDGYFSHRGMTGFAVEAGQHDDKDSAAYHEGCIWIALREVCGLDFDHLPEIPAAALTTIHDTPDPKIFEIIHRFGLKDDDNFEMKPGFENFQPIKKGEILATLNGETIKSTWDAYIFMPLYQSQGNDGFFIVEPVSE